SSPSACTGRSTTGWCSPAGRTRLCKRSAGGRPRSRSIHGGRASVPRRLGGVHSPGHTDSRSTTGMLRSLRIGTRLALGFGVIVAVMAAVAVGATLYGKASRKELATLIETASAKEALAADMKSLLLEQANYMRNVGLQSEVKDMQASEDRAKQLDEAYSKAIERMSHLQLGGEEKASLEALKRLDQQIDPPFKQALALATGFHSEEAAKVITQELDPPVQKALGELNRLIEIQKKANRAAIDEARVNGDRVATVVFAVQGVALAVSLLMAWLVT